jgi:ketosteroid isomerase-like protein
VSAGNVELVWRFLGASPDRSERVHWNSERWAEASELWDSEIEYQEDPAWPGATTVTGRDAVVARFLEYQEFLGEAVAEVEDVLDAGDDKVVVLTRISGAGASSGVPWEYLWAYILTLKDARVVAVRAYLDADEAFRVAGIDPTARA